MNLDLSLNFKYAFQNTSTKEVYTKVFNLGGVEEEYFQYHNLQQNGYELIARSPSINVYDKHKNELFNGDILKINDSVYVIKILGSAAALLYPDQDNVFEYFHNLCPNNYVGERVGDIYTNPNFLHRNKEERTLKALKILKEYKELDGVVIIPAQQLNEAIAELKALTTTIPLLDLFQLMIFESPEALHVKAKELNCVPPYKDADDIRYLHGIAGTLYERGYKLFYFKKAFSTKELELLVYCDDYQEVKNKPNFYINSNHNTGVLYVVENLTKESTNE